MNNQIFFFFIALPQISANSRISLLGWFLLVLFFVIAGMDKDEKTQIANKALESDFFLQWGNKKRLRCVRVRGPEIISQRSDGVFRRKITTRIDRRIVSPATEKEASHPQSNRLTRLDWCSVSLLALPRRERASF